MATKFNSIDFAEAETAQENAATDSSNLVQLIAGSGTGKSFSIEKRVAFLLQNGVSPNQVYAVSYTRAAANDLQLRIRAFCHNEGLPTSINIRTSTLHALALKILRKAGILGNMYPSAPVVLDEWEVENIFDAEFSDIFKVNKSRVAEIRAYYEAYWNTGSHSHVSYIQASPPVTEKEQTDFEQFKINRAFLYSCVLPGEIVQLVVEKCHSGTLDVVSILGITHLIIDEFQDLNPMDVSFIDFFIKNGITVFACGDDDQSIYSFRYGSSNTIRELQKKYNNCGSHILNHCFRCTPNVLNAAQALITSYGDQDRISKNYISMYEKSDPSIMGTYHRWNFSTHKIESQAIAESCSSLINAGLPPRDILILISNKKSLLPKIKKALTDKKIDYESADEVSFFDSSKGRWVLGLIRLACNKDDYVGLRILWGETPGVGIKAIIALANWIISSNLDFKEVFFTQSVLTGLDKSTTKLLHRVQEIIATISSWTSNDTFSIRNDQITNIINDVLGTDAATNLSRMVINLPSEITLLELRDYLWASTDEQKIRILNTIYERLGLPIQQNNLLPPKIRIMTMHGSKGLSAQIVFIPGLEEEVLPGRNRKTPGHIQEAARLLYVAITRAKIACILSYSKSRFINGKMANHTPSRFTSNLGGVFMPKIRGFTSEEVATIISESESLK